MAPALAIRSAKAVIVTIPTSTASKKTSWLLGTQKGQKHGILRGYPYLIELDYKGFIWHIPMLIFASVLSGGP